jgi:hypothetical protein
MVDVMARRRSSLLLCFALTLVAAAPAPAPAFADSGSGGGDDEARVSKRCGSAATSLRLRSHDGTIRVEFELERRRAGERWRVVIVHERSVAWRGTVRTASSGRLRVRRSVADLDGVDRVTVRASGPGATTCEVGARLLG